MGSRSTQFTVVARLTTAFKRLLPGLQYESVNQQWEMAEFEYRPHGWPQARRFVVARRFIPNDEPQSTLFTLGRYGYRAWVTNMDLTPSGIWHYYDGRATIEPRICELREDYASQDSHRVIRGQRLIPGNRSPCLKPVPCLSGDWSGGILAESHLAEASLQA